MSCTPEMLQSHEIVSTMTSSDLVTAGTTAHYDFACEFKFLTRKTDIATAATQNMHALPGYSAAALQ